MQHCSQQNIFNRRRLACRLCSLRLVPWCVTASVKVAQWIWFGREWWFCCDWRWLASRWHRCGRVGCVELSVLQLDLWWNWIVKLENWKNLHNDRETGEDKNRKQRKHQDLCTRCVPFGLQCSDCVFIVYFHKNSWNIKTRIGTFDPRVKSHLGLIIYLFNHQHRVASHEDWNSPVMEVKSRKLAKFPPQLHLSRGPHFDLWNCSFRIHCQKS